MTAGYGQDLADSLGRPKVMRLDEHRVLKSTSSREIDHMQFVAANTSIPVPKIYNTKSDGDETHVVMEYIPNESLEKAWKKLSHDQKVASCQQIIGYLAQIKPLTGDRIQGLNDAPVRVGYYRSRWGGPFDNEKDFNRFLTKGVVSEDFLADNHTFHFAHGDLSPRNILVNGTGCITAVLDWEWAGWYPEYWDVTRMLLDLPEKRKMPDYPTHLRSVLSLNYEKEVSALSTVIKLQGFDLGGIPVDQISPYDD